MASDGESTSHNDPNFAVICSFLEQFGKTCGLEAISIKDLQKEIENTHETPECLKALHLKLLRRVFKTVHVQRWEKSLIKFCHQQAYHQDAWELERFGYKKANVARKLAILKNLLVHQFICHTKFKNDINKLESRDLRLEPLGKDSKGRIYWLHIDRRANIRLYREDQDEETWTLIARDKVSYVEVLQNLREGREPVVESSNTSDIINEDSNSTEIPGKSGGEEPDNPPLDKSSSDNEGETGDISKDTSVTDESTADKSEDPLNESHNDPQPKKRPKISRDNSRSSSIAEDESKDISEDKPDDKSEDNSEDKPEDKSEVKPEDKSEDEPEDKSEDKSEEESEDEIEEKVIVFTGEGEGAECDSVPFFGDEISDPVLYFWGEGQGHDCDTGNPQAESSVEERKGETKSKGENSTAEQDNGVIGKTDVVEEPSPVKPKLWSVEAMCNTNDNRKTDDKKITNSVLLDTNNCNSNNKDPTDNSVDVPNDNVKVEDGSGSEQNGNENQILGKHKATEPVPVTPVEAESNNDKEEVLPKKPKLDKNKESKEAASNSSEKDEANAEVPPENVVLSNDDDNQNKTLEAKDIETSSKKPNFEKTNGDSNEAHVNAQSDLATKSNLNTETNDNALPESSEKSDAEPQTETKSEEGQNDNSNNTKTEITEEKKDTEEENQSKKPRLQSSEINEDEVAKDEETPKIARPIGRPRRKKDQNSTPNGAATSETPKEKVIELPVEIPKRGRRGKKASQAEQKEEEVDTTPNKEELASETLDRRKTRVTRLRIAQIVETEKPTTKKSKKGTAATKIPTAEPEEPNKKSEFVDVDPTKETDDEKPNLKRKKDGESSRKRSYDEAESNTAEEKDESKRVKRIKMRTKRPIKMKYKLNKKEVETNSTDEEAPPVEKPKPPKGKLQKGKKLQKETEPKPSKKDEKAKDPKVKGKLKKNAPAETDPLDISDQTPVRQSRRIAQLKIHEEAQRRQMEEIALRELKEKHKKKGGKEKPADAEWKVSSPDHSSGSEHNSQQKKKGTPKPAAKNEKSWQKGWHSSSAEHSATESDGPLEELDYQEEPEDDFLKDKSDHEFSPESEAECEEYVPVRIARTLRKRTETKEEEEIEEDKGCVACGGKGQPEWILLCDDCDEGRHAACLKPILFLIPEGHWYCPPCSEKRLIKALEDKLEEYELLVNIIENEPKEEIKEEEEKEMDSGSDDTSRSDSGSDSSSTESDGKIYRLRERRQLPISYHFKEYDQLISSAIKEEYKEETSTAGNQGRGKDISTIIEADKEEKEKAKLQALQAESADKENGGESEDEEEKKRRARIRAQAVRRKPRKLTTLDIPSDDDDYDEDFKDTGITSGSSSEDSDDITEPSSNSSSSDRPLRRSRRDNHSSKRRKRLVESPEIKKKRSGFFEDSTSSESSDSKAWSSSKKKHKKSRHSDLRSKENRRSKKKRKKNLFLESDEEPKKPKSHVRYGGLSDSDASHDWSPAHRTRQKKINYTEMPNTDSEAEAHKPSGKHMDSTDEYKGESDSSDSDWGEDKNKELGSSEEKNPVPEKDTKDLEKNDLESPEKQADPGDKPSESISQKVVSDNPIPETVVNAMVGQNIRGKVFNRGARAIRGFISSRGRGAIIRSGSLNTSMTDTDGGSNLDGSDMKSDDGALSEGQLKAVKKKPVLPLTPLQAERERKRLEKVAKLAERELKRVEKLKIKEEKAQERELKAKEREEKRLARLAAIESKKPRIFDSEGEMRFGPRPGAMNLAATNGPHPFRGPFRPQMPRGALGPRFPPQFFRGSGPPRPRPPPGFPFRRRRPGRRRPTRRRASSAASSAISRASARTTTKSNNPPSPPDPPALYLYIGTY